MDTDTLREAAIDRLLANGEAEDRACAIDIINERGWFPKMRHTYNRPTEEQLLQERAILFVYRRGGIAALAEWAVATAHHVNKEEIYDLQRQVEELKDQLAGRNIPVEWDEPYPLPREEQG